MSRRRSAVRALQALLVIGICACAPPEREFTDGVEPDASHADASPDLGSTADSGGAGGADTSVNDRQDATTDGRPDATSEGTRGDTAQGDTTPGDTTSGDTARDIQ